MGLGDAEDFEEGWGDVAEAAVMDLGLAFCKVFADDYDGDGVGCVGGKRRAGGGEHLFGVAVVGGDDGVAFGFYYCVNEAADAFVNRFDGGYGGGNYARVADHIAVCEVED